MKFLELFAGIGGFRRGLEELGHECVGFVEWDKYARKSYEAIWPSAREEWTANDITAVTDESIRGLTRSIGRVDLIAFGFPCQAFSVAGKRGGFEDTRGTLFFDAARFAMVFRPKLLLAENVPGLLNHDGGRTFYTILCALDELGYDAEWQVCNAKNFGIPQNRERVFIVGHLRGTGGRKVFPLRKTNCKTVAELKCVGMLDIKGQDVIRRVYSPTGISPTLTTMDGGNREPKIIQTNQRNETVLKDVSGTIHQSMSSRQAPKILQRGRGFNDGGLHDIAPTASSHSYHENNMVVSATNDRRHGVTVIRKTHGSTTTVNFEQTGTLQAARLDKIPCVINNDARGELSISETVGTLRANSHGNHPMVPHDARIRKLTPLECWRLMGRQDWEFERAKQAGVSDSQLYKQAGNSLVPQIVTAIARNF